MPVTAVQKRKGYIAIGGVCLLLGAAYLGLAVELPFGTLDQPGAAVFPVLVGTLMIVISLVTVWEGWRMLSGDAAEFPLGEDLRRLVGLVAALLVYFIALPWVGQLIGSACFATALVRLLSGKGWLRCAAYGVIIAILLHVVFVVALKVTMPRGPFDF